MLTLVGRMYRALLLNDVWLIQMANNPKVLVKIIGLYSFHHRSLDSHLVMMEEATILAIPRELGQADYGKILVYVEKGYSAYTFTVPLLTIMPALIPF